MTYTLPRQGLYAPKTSKKEQDGECLGKVSFSYTLEGASRAGLVHYSAIPVQKALSGTVSCTNVQPGLHTRHFARINTGLQVLCTIARLMHATGLCATGGCRIQASTRDRLVHKSGLCTRHYGTCYTMGKTSCVCSPYSIIIKNIITLTS